MNKHKAKIYDQCTYTFMTVAPFQLKINIFYNELNTFANNNWVMFFYKEFFRKCREI